MSVVPNQADQADQAGHGAGDGDGDGDGEPDGDAGAHRPPPRPWHATTSLKDFAIVSWLVPPERLAPVLPLGFVPVTVDDGRAVVSMVGFRHHRFRFRAAGRPALSCGQIDYRAHVRRGAQTGVYFLGTLLDTPLALVPRAAWAMPSERRTVAVDASWREGRLGSLRISTSGPWAPYAHLVPTRVDTTPSPLRRSTFTDPLIAWFLRRSPDGAAPALGRLTVWHGALAPRLEPATVVHARGGLLEERGLVERGQPPAAALVAPSTDFDVHLPPRAVARP